MFGASCSTPKALFEIESFDNQVPVTLHFNNLSSDADSYAWHFGEGTSSVEKLTSNRYLHSGVYNITLRAFKGKKTATYTQKVFLNAPQKCLIEVETHFGNMTLELYNETPGHQENFLKNIRKGYYDGISFHRVIRGFMIQAGDENTKTDNLSKTGLKDIPLESEIRNDLFHTKGALAMARQPDGINPTKKSSNTQFYIVQGAPVSMASIDNYEIEKNIEYSDEIKKIYKNMGGTPQLDKEYTIFGHLIDGFDVLDKIAGVSTDNSDKPLEDVVIIKITEIK